MFIEVQIPDDVFEAYGRDRDKITERIIDTAGVNMEARLAPYQLTPQHIADLTRHFGPFKDAQDLINRIKNVGTIRLQSVAHQLDADQIQALREQAYFYAEAGEPTSYKEAQEGDFTVEQRKRVVNRYLEEQLKTALDIVFGLN